MRKVLLATTAMVGLSAASAMATDISISGGANFIYKQDTMVTADTAQQHDDGQTDVEMDLTVTLSGTTDSGISTTMTFGLDEENADSQDGTSVDATQAVDDANATIAGDFGTIKFIGNASDGNFVASMDENADVAGEGNGGVMTTLAGDAGDSIGFQFPSMVDGMTIAVEHSNGGTAGEHFGYGIGYDAGMAAVKYAKIMTNTVTHTSTSITTAAAGVGLAYEMNKSEEGTTEADSTIMGLTYSMDGGITLAYEDGKTEDEDGDTTNDYSQLAVSYTIAPGMTAVVTSSEEDANGAGADNEELELQLKLSF